ncbi:HPr kinase/phosphorylase [Polymorphum gilvum]|uniref:Serine kinase of the HPr protein, regulates carbohydrat e metabolism n=1 Tax=Polymorphum gilvum (strain LMG 25793 / CGMCC 1.9160 / SL003B-26A1) TaxID=991905 RepID=F2IVA3_POLGS|nr:HPr kinase/phosphatase C-terminal domain-containing protein [Polymorphum gilvum]ADZ72621.1 Serine kinase of the HPr protein, regulates carbohydrat e metabolism [Polymorphum gilvum SL003B-26A1]
MTAATVHAGCVVLGTAGVLLRGRSGSGKSALAEALVRAAAVAGNFSAHVADDRVMLSAGAGRLVARPAAPIAGLLEVRGRGIVAVPHEPAALVRLVVDLVPHDQLPRLPEPADLLADVAGIRVPRQMVPERSTARAVDLVRWALRDILSAREAPI